MSNEEQIKAVARMQMFIEEQLCEKITLLDLAKVAGYSPWYSAKIFKQHTLKTPFEYIRSLRLTRAALILRDDGPKVMDVALDFVFDSHEGFTRAFSKEFGINPKKYIRETPPIRLFIPYTVSDYYQSLIRNEANDMEKETSTVFTQVIEKPARKLILKRGVEAREYFAYCEEVGCDIWGVLSSIKEALSEPMGLWLPRKLIKKGTSKYVQGVEVPLDYEGDIPEGYDIIDLEPMKIMIFQGQPYDDELFGEAIGALQSVIKTYDPTFYGFVWQEDGIKFQLEPQGYRGYIEGKEVASKS
ncbi:MAG: AraC family transcriptional regulator [Vallitaleaceae bacterium]|jgi:AraC family transcriptional regulator|nr:AraC family transcriptional regulator [Vallitaleaceae bacterium]